MASDTDRDQRVIEKDWLALHLKLPRELEETACVVLFELGCTGTAITAEDADTITIAGYYDSTHNEAELVAAVRTRLRDASGRDPLSIECSRLPDQDWMKKWKQGFSPIEVGRRIVVAPSWAVPASTGDRLIVQIDPGMAFGTGTHETTRLCLELLDKHWTGGSLLDVGTGSGILAIAAALLAPGARVVGIDVDPVAVEVARENVLKNEVEHTVYIEIAQPRDYIGGEFDAVVANLTAEVIIDLLPELEQCAKSSGTLILSGILDDLARSVERKLIEHGFAILEARSLGEWCAFVARRGQ